MTALAPLPKVQAGGIIRTSLDNTWQTPPEILEPARVDYFGGTIPFDPASALSNPTRAERFCVGRLEDVPPLMKKLDDGKTWVETEEERRERGLERRRSFYTGLARGSAIGGALSFSCELAAFMPETLPAVSATIDGRRVHAVLETERTGRMPFVSGLEIDWPAPTWVNPPYGRELKAWLAKIREQALRGVEIVALLPCARWEQRYFTRRTLGVARHVCFIEGRVAFISSIDYVPVQGNPYASMLVGWNTNPGRWLEAFGPLGACMDVRLMRRRREVCRRVPTRPAALPLFDKQLALEVGGDPCL